MAFGGTALKLFQTVLYALEFCCAGIILGIYSYFLSVLADREIYIAREWLAVEGISGIAAVYTIFAVLLTCFLGGKIFFAFLAIVIDILLVGGFIAIAVLTREGSKSCSGVVNTPIGRGLAGSRQGFTSVGDGNEITYAVSLGTACRLNTAAFAVAIVGAVLFLLSALVQLFIGRNHKKEKRFGPSPKNNYTKGSGIKFWQRRNKKATTVAHTDPEMAGGAPVTSAPGATLAPGTNDIRPSHDTAYTGSTYARNSTVIDDPNKPIQGGYHTAPTGTYNVPHVTNNATNY